MSSNSQEQQTASKGPISPSQGSSETSSPEQPEVNEELKAAFAQLLAILNKYHSDQKKTSIRELWKTYRTATLLADYYKRVAHVQPQELNLDAATANDFSHLRLMKDYENQALNILYAISGIMRANRAMFAELEQVSRKILSLDDNTFYGELSASVARDTLKSIQKKGKTMESVLMKLSKYSG
ncbi:hypothetical protein QM012_003739 [Aureobasidium pullulans]|uniref:Proteasome regulatory particle subunit n=1 Tax=Aureobasidium pullulans TaxID=5580 RepID=A0ABR0T7S6_AURPU